MATLMLEFVVVLLVALSGSGADARELHTGSGGYKLSSVVKEYANQQGFEAKLVVSSPSGNDSLGRDISPLSFIVRQAHRSLLANIWVILCSYSGDTVTIPGSYPGMVSCEASSSSARWCIMSLGFEKSRGFLTTLSVCFVVRLQD